MGLILYLFYLYTIVFYPIELALPTSTNQLSKGSILLFYPILTFIKTPICSAYSCADKPVKVTASLF
jgi:hypothetical protein